MFQYAAACLSVAAGARRRAQRPPASLAAQRGQRPAGSDREHHASSGWVPLRSAPTPASAPGQHHHHTSWIFLGPSTMFIWRPCICGACSTDTSSPQSSTKRCRGAGRQAGRRGEGVCLLNVAWADLHPQCPASRQRSRF